MSGAGAETIAAVATAPGRGGIGIVRISGDRALAVAERIFRRRGGGPLAAARPWSLVVGAVVDPASGEHLDEALAVRMPAGRSYTGEETVEIHGHGGPAVLEEVLAAALAAGARHAAPGEFTRRAFTAGRMDLAQAEAVAELVDAGSPALRREALRRLGGAATRVLGALRERLLALSATVEVLVAFDDEEGEGEGAFPGEEIRGLAREVAQLAAAGCRGSTADRRPRVVVAGRPNAGKSSLFNYLCGAERAIVTAEPGTTRDFIEAAVVIAGREITLIDTAGVRESGCEAERAGAGRSLEQAALADAVLHLVDGATRPGVEDGELSRALRGRPGALVVTKVDLPRVGGSDEVASLAAGRPVLEVSVVSGEGVRELVSALAAILGPAGGEGRAAAGFVPNARQAGALERAAAHLETAASLGDAGGVDLAAEELRAASAALDETTGAGAAGELLERVFSGFCIGK